MTRRSPEQWTRVEQRLKLGVSWRFYSCRNGRMAIWTTEALYKNGPYQAVLAEADGTVLMRADFRLRTDAKKQALLWTNTHHGGTTHEIEELP